MLVEQLRDLPSGMLSDLVDEAERAGLRFPGRLAAEWASGVNRFDRPGEALFAARAGSRLIGMCGLNVDPYMTVPRVGRVRHLYVLEAHRRDGVGRCLIQAVIGAASGHFDRLRLRTSNPAAARLYEAVGFARCAEADCSYALDLCTEPS